MKAAARYNNPGQKSAPLIRWLWLAVENMGVEHRAKFLQFVTGSSQLPAGGIEQLDPPLNVSFVDGADERLPVAHTCFHTLDLPHYTSYDSLQKRLLTAIEEGSEGFGQL